MKPVIKIEKPADYRRCTGCYAPASHDLVLGHETDNGRNGNTQSIALCGDCARELTVLLVEETT